jgi:hypothetical protein
VNRGHTLLQDEGEGDVAEAEAAGRCVDVQAGHSAPWDCLGPGLANDSGFVAVALS